MIVLKLLILALWLLVLPFAAGLTLSMHFPITRRTLGITYIAGLLISFALFELAAIPCMLLVQYSAFVAASRIYAAAEILAALAGIYSCVRLWKKDKGSRSFNSNHGVSSVFSFIFPGESGSQAEAMLSPRTDPRLIKPFYNIESIIFWLLFAGLLLFQLYMAVTRASFDGDDAFYVVESLLAQQAEVMNTILPYTGITTELEFRHAMAVFTMWVAFLARQCHIHATIVSHTLLPVILIPLVYLVYIEIGKILLRDKREMLPVFMIAVSLLIMFGNTSIYTAETFLMMRTWQGKAMVANLILPLILWVFLWMFEDCRKPGFLWREETGGVRFTRNSAWVMLVLVNMASGIMSSMGILFGSALGALLTLLLFIYTKDIRTPLKGMLALVPNIIYLTLYLIFK